MYPPIDIEQAINNERIDARDNPTRRDDYQLVRAFGRLKGRPSRPIDRDGIEPRARKEFEARLSRVGGEGFFEPFNRLLELIGRPPIRVEPRMEAIGVWNEPEFIPRIVAEICDRLDRGSSPLLVPRLVSAFLNLERDRPPERWSAISAINVPGSRTYDRAAEAFRAYLRTDGPAWIVTSGRAPYYDKENEAIQVTEAEANAAYLRLLGVPGDRIVKEERSRDTDENVEFLPHALKMIENATGSSVRGLLLVTSPFHLARYRLAVESMPGLSGVEVFALGSKASRYWAETYFLSDAKSFYTREETIGVVLNEYAKIAFDICATRQPGAKATATRGPSA